MEWDVIVVGGRVAGSPLAMLLARRGWRVLVVDRARFGTDTVCTTFLQQPALRLLTEWGLEESLAASGCPPINSVETIVGGHSRGRWPLAGRTFAPRRALLDEMLVNAAESAGATMRDEFIVRALDFDGSRVVGVRGHAVASTKDHVERARWVIGADGGASVVARQVEAFTYEARPSLGSSWHAYWSGVAVDGFRFASGSEGGLGAAPTNDGLASIFLGVPADEDAAFRKDPDTAFVQAANKLDPSLGDQLAREGRRESRWFVATETPAWFRRPHGDGWALVGDAGFRQWPSTGHGITDAFRDSQLLADALVGIGDHAVSEAGVFEAYERTRNECSIDVFETIHGKTVAAELASLPRRASGFVDALAKETARGIARLRLS